MCHVHPALTPTYKKTPEGLLTGNDVIRFAFQRAISGSWVKDGLGAAIIKAELLTVLCKPGTLV